MSLFLKLLPLGLGKPLGILLSITYGSAFGVLLLSPERFGGALIPLAGLILQSALTTVSNMYLSKKALLSSFPEWLWLCFYAVMLILLLATSFYSLEAVLQALYKFIIIFVL